MIASGKYQPDEWQIRGAGAKGRRGAGMVGRSAALLFIRREPASRSVMPFPAPLSTNERPEVDDGGIRVAKRASGIKCVSGPDILAEGNPKSCHHEERVDVAVRLPRQVLVNVRPFANERVDPVVGRDVAERLGIDPRRFAHCGVGFIVQA